MSAAARDPQVSTVVVERPGMLTTVQDAGRWGWQHLGVSVSGWMDDWSARVANRLVGNDETAAVLEVSLLGPTLRLEGPATLAITGARFEVTIGSRTVSTPLLTPVADGEQIRFGTRHAGARAYVAVGGGLAIAPVLGSRSTDVRAGLGGRRLERGDRLTVTPVPAAGRVRLRELAAPEWLFARRLQVLEGPDGAPGAANILESLCAADYLVTAASDRTGYRLDGPPLPATPAAMASVPVTRGVVQLPPDGHPILLMADCQTTGGYARIGAVSRADLAVAGQLAPGDFCRFERCTLAEAARAWSQRRLALDAMVESAR